eukprot:scaffold2911_cov414-Prasinococcus_capsulatus_cf.AAC.44
MPFVAASGRSCCVGLGAAGVTPFAFCSATLLPGYRGPLGLLDQLTLRWYCPNSPSTPVFQGLQKLSAAAASAARPKPTVIVLRESFASLGGGNGVPFVAPPDPAVAEPLATEAVEAACPVLEARGLEPRGVACCVPLAAEVAGGESPGEVAAAVPWGCGGADAGVSPLAATGCREAGAFATGFFLPEPVALALRFCRSVRPNKHEAGETALLPCSISATPSAQGWRKAPRERDPPAACCSAPGD